MHPVVFTNNSEALEDLWAHVIVLACLIFITVFRVRIQVEPIKLHYNDGDIFVIVNYFSVTK